MQIPVHFAGARRCRLAIHLLTPTPHLALQVQAACVQVARGDGCERLVAWQLGGHGHFLEDVPIVAVHLPCAKGGVAGSSHSQCAPA